MSTGSISTPVRTALEQHLNASELAALLSLNGQEQNADCLWQLELAIEFDSTMFADELGSDAPYTLLAWSGSGDAWALDHATRSMVFLNHDDWVSDQENTMVVPLGVGVLTFVAVMNDWTATQEQLESDDLTDEDQVRKYFMEHLTEVHPLLAANWPYA